MAENSNSSSSNPRTRPVPEEKLVKVFDSERESEALVVSGLLASAGIDSRWQNLASTAADDFGPQPGKPGKPSAESPTRAR